MQQNIRKEQFILLCNELEQKTINQNQFGILSDMKNFTQAEKILQIMKMEDLVNKNYLFGILEILSVSEYWFDIYCTMFQYPAYRKDVKRQNYIEKHFGDIGIQKIMELLQYDFCFEDQDFLKNMPVCSKENQSFINRVDILCSDMKSVENTKFYEQEAVQKLVKIALLDLNSHDSMEDFIKIMHLDNMLERPIWFEYLIKIYNKNEKENCPYIYHTLVERLIKNNRINETTKKIEEINKSEKQEEEKVNIASKFLNNLKSIKDDVLENCSNEHFAFLLNQAMDDEIPFYYAKDMVEIAKENHLSLSYIFKFLKSIGKVENQNARTIFINALKKHPNLINGFDFQKVQKSDYEGAFSLLIKEAIRLNDEEFIEKGKNYFGETFSKDFISYISKNNLTETELFGLRDQIIMASSNFDSNQKTFIVDTTGMIDMNLIEEKKQVPTEVEEQPKGLWKKLSEKF